MSGIISRLHCSFQLYDHPVPQYRICKVGVTYFKAVVRIKWEVPEDHLAQSEH